MLCSSVSVSCLLFVDDVILIADSAEDLQRSLDVCFNFFCLNHLQISQIKSNIIIFNRSAKTPRRTWTFGPLVLEEVNFYKYLGYVISASLSCKNNLQHKRGLIEAALATCMAVASSEVLHHIKIDTLLQLYNTCIVQIILYCTEMWSETSYEALEQLQYRCLKRILRIPSSTPNPATIIETGNLPIQVLVDRRQLLYYHKLKSTPSSLAGKMLAIQENASGDLPHSWAHRIQGLLVKYGLIYQDDLIKERWKQIIRMPTYLYGNSLVFEQAGRLSKMSKLLVSKNSIKREQYISCLPLYKTTLIFKARCRMLNLKNNFRGSKVGLTCDLCKAALEDDDHIFNICPALEDIRTDLQITRNELFRNDISTERMSIIADFLCQVERMLRKL